MFVTSSVCNKIMDACINNTDMHMFTVLASECGLKKREAFRTGSIGKNLSKKRKQLAFNGKEKAVNWNFCICLNSGGKMEDKSWLQKY